VALNPTSVLKVEINIPPITKIIRKMKKTKHIRYTKIYKIILNIKNC
jgi:hypothetical protein